MSPVRLRPIGRGSLIRRSLLGAALAVALLPLAAGAQDPRLDGRLDQKTLAGVTVVLDSARAAGLPTEPLVQKALEGAAKHADGARIVTTVRSLSLALDQARGALGQESTPSELTAGAEALHAGVGAAILTRLRSARRHESLSVPLAVLTDLIARGVPVDTAAGAVFTLALGPARDEDFMGLRLGVDRDVQAGIAPAIAVAARVRGMPSTAPPRSAAADAAFKAGQLGSSTDVPPNASGPPHPVRP